jgi:hypothetical protein
MKMWSHLRDILDLYHPFRRILFSVSQAREYKPLTEKQYFGDKKRVKCWKIISEGEKKYYK